MLRAGGGRRGVRPNRPTLPIPSGAAGPRSVAVTADPKPVAIVLVCAFGQVGIADVPSVATAELPGAARSLLPAGSLLIPFRRGVEVACLAGGMEGAVDEESDGVADHRGLRGVRRQASACPLALTPPQPATRPRSVRTSSCPAVGSHCSFRRLPADHAPSLQHTADVDRGGPSQLRNDQLELPCGSVLVGPAMQ